MAVVRVTIGKGQDFEDESLLDGVIPRNNLVPYVKTFVDDKGNRRTPGLWLTVIADGSFAGGRHDVGTVVETYLGTEEAKPNCKIDHMLKRFFVVNGYPELIRPKLHKLDPVQPEDVLSRTGVHVNAAEAVKGKAELARGDDK